MGDVTFQQSVAVLGEHRHVPHRRLDRQADEPAKQDVVAQLLHQLPLRADREERLQQQGPQQLLGWDRGPASQRVDLVELRRQTLQGCVHQRADLAQWMIRRHHRLRVYGAAQMTSLMIPPAHLTASLSVTALASGNQIDGGCFQGFFRSLLMSMPPASTPLTTRCGWAVTATMSG